MTLRAASLVFLASVSISAQRPVAPFDWFGPLRFLGGRRGDQSGQPGRGSSERTYEFVLDGRFLQVQNTSTYPPQEKNKKGEVHHDMRMIGYDRGRKKLVFRQFHTEGFVNTYVQEVNDDRKRLVFTSEGIENIARAGALAKHIGFRATTNSSNVSNSRSLERISCSTRKRT